jgi:AAA-like domain
MYQVGGSLGANATSYVKRQADADLYQALKTGKFCYVLNSRQMGKSSLKVQMIYQLEAEGVACVSVDITEIGTQGVTMQQWYGALIQRLAQRFDLGDFERRSWLQARLDMTTVQVFGEFVETVLLARTKGAIVVFLDEIDSMLRLPFKDDFFALLRAFENKRSENPDLGRLTWCLLGVATPRDLIEDPLRTPFNIAQGIELKGFEQSDCLGLAAGLRSANAEALLSEILGWTGGQPFLTQKLCNLVNLEEESAYPGQEAEWVSQLVQSQVIRQWETQDTPEHLKTLRDRLLLSDVKLRLRLLGLYRQILQQEEVLVDDSLDQLRLRLTGLVVKRGGSLKSYNPIYQQVFDRVWVEQAMTDLRPYGVAMQSWVLSDRQDTESLLSGVALQEAVVWAEDKRLGDQDYRFLAASQNAENEAKLALEQRANQILKAAEVRAKRRGLLGAGILALSLVGSLLVAWKTQAERNYLRQVSQVERNAAAALKLSKDQPLDGLIAAMEAAQELRKILPDPKNTSIYPTYIPLQSLATTLAEVKVFNQLNFFGKISDSVPMNPVGSEFATIEANDKVKLWGKDGNLINELDGGGETKLFCTNPHCEKTEKMFLQGGDDRFYINSVHFSPSGDALVASRLSKVLAWDKSGKYCGSIPTTDGFIREVSWSVNGDHLIVRHRNQTHDGKYVNYITVYENKSIGPWCDAFSENKLKKILEIPFNRDVWPGKTVITNIDGEQKILTYINHDQPLNSIDKVQVWNFSGEKVKDVYSFSKDSKIVYLGDQVIENPSTNLAISTSGNLAIAKGKDIYIFYPYNSQVEILRTSHNQPIREISFFDFLVDSNIITTDNAGEKHFFTSQLDVQKNDALTAKRQSLSAELRSLAHKSYSLSAELRSLAQKASMSTWQESDILIKQQDELTKQQNEIRKVSSNIPQPKSLPPISHIESMIGKSDWQFLLLSQNPAIAITQDSDQTIRFDYFGKLEIIGKIWDQQHENVDYAAYGPDRKKLATISLTPNLVKLWNVDDGKPLGEISIDNQSTQDRKIMSSSETPKNIRFSPNGEFLAIKSEENIIDVWSINGQKNQKVATDKLDLWTRFSFTSDSSKIVLFQEVEQKGLKSETRKSMHQVTYWDFKNGSKSSPRTLEIPNNSIFQGLTQDGKFWMTHNATTGDLHLNSIDEKEELKLRMKTAPSSFRLYGYGDVTVSLDRQMIAIVNSKNSSVDILDSSGRRLTSLKGINMKSGSVKMQFSQDNSKLFILDGRLRVWTVSGELIEERDGFSASDSISPDGSSVVKKLPDIVTLYPIYDLNSLLARGCKHLKIYLNSHPEARKRLPICQDPAIQNHRYNSPSPSPSAQSKINNYNSSLAARKPRKQAFQAESITTTAVR